MLCPNCDADISPEILRAKRSMPVKGEPVEVDDRFLRCPVCSEEWSEEGFDVAAEAYRIYRDAHGLLQPVEIRAFRKRLGLTQEELAKLLGWSEATVNRYEKGALQDRSHDLALKMAGTNEGLRTLLESRKDALPSKKWMRLWNSSPSHSASLADIMTPEQSEWTGFQLYSPAKIKALIGFFGGSTGVWKTALCKLIWYTDNVHYRDHGVSITGLAFVRYPHGPVPTNHRLLFALLPEEGFEVEEEEFANGMSGERIRSRGEPDLSVFGALERETMERVKTELGSLGAAEISNLSHEEAAWKVTAMFERMSFASKVKAVTSVRAS